VILSLPSTGQALLAVVALNSTVSLIQNYKVGKLMVSFFDYSPKEVVLLRDGQRVPLDAKEVSNWDSRQNWEG